MTHKVNTFSYESLLKSFNEIFIIIHNVQQFGLMFIKIFEIEFNI